MIECWLPDARHLRDVPGKKTDVLDAEWICQLVEHGLMRPSFVPPRPIRELRDLTRYRKAQITGARSEGAAARRGPRWTRGRLRAKLPLLREALSGRFDGHHALIVGEILAKLDYLDEAIGRLGAEVDRVIAPFEAELTLLVTIPGVERRTAEALIAEIGVDMARFGTSARLASWAGLCPGLDESAGKRRSGRTRKGSEWLGTALAEAAEARKAVAHSILVAAFHILDRGVPYHDLGARGHQLAPHRAPLGSFSYQRLGGSRVSAMAAARIPAMTSRDHSVVRT